MMNFSKIAASIVFVLVIKTAVATPPVAVKQFINPKDWSFVENKGQLADKDGKIIPGVNYYSHKGGASLYCQPGKVSFVFTSIVTDRPISEATGKPESIADRIYFENKGGTTQINRLDLSLEGANLNAVISASDKQEYYENYNLAFTPTEGITHVSTYKTITYSNIYPNIDMVLHAQEGGMKYEFVIRPGGNPDDIQLQWQGAKKMTLLENGGLHYSFPLGEMSESKPVTFAANGNQISSNFIKENNNIRFGVGNYDHTQTITIDPSVTWATYLGGNSQDFGQATWADNTGNILMVGKTTSASGIATSGAFQTSYVGTVSNAFVSKFTSAGAIIWSTYYGGTSYNDGWSLGVDNSNNIYFTGTTSSTSGIATSGVAQSFYGGGTYNAYVVKLSPSGSRIWGTYFGGSGGGLADQGLFLATDPSGNVFLTNWTSSSGLATSGAYQTSYAGGGLDAGLVKFSPAGLVIWSTYYGGSGEEWATGVATDASGNAIITGATGSSSAIATTGAYQTSFSGGTYDGYVASFSPTGKLNWGTYLGGNGTDSVNAAIVDYNGNIIVCGQTTSTTGIASSGAYQTSNGGGDNAFITSFKSSGTLNWSTFYGGNGTTNANGIAVDLRNRVFITGPTSSQNGIASLNASQKANGGGLDAFIAQFDQLGNFVYGSYFGGAGDENAWGIGVEPEGNPYITGYSTSSSGIATSGAYQTTNAGGQDAFIAAYLNFNTYSVDAGITAIVQPSAAICTGQVPVKVMLHNYAVNDLTKVTIGWSVNGKIQTSYSWTGVVKSKTETSVTLGNFTFPVGIDTIKAWTSKPNGLVDSIPKNDTDYFADTVNALPKANAGKPGSVCAGSPFSIGTPNAIKGHTYAWNSNPGSFTSTSSNPTVNPTVTTTYYVVETVTGGGCTSLDSVKVTAVPIPKPNSGGGQVICYGGSATLGEPSKPTHKYFWSSVPTGFTSTLSNPTAYGLTASTTFYETDIDTTAGCYGYGSAVVTVAAPLKANAGGSHSICTGTNIILGGSPTAGHTYSWTSKPVGFTSTISNPTVAPKVNTTYYVAETITATGCIQLDSAPIFLNTLPSPNAGPDQTVCSGSTVTLSAKLTSGDTYAWSSFPTGFSSTASKVTDNPNSSISYILTETIKTTGCSKADTVLVTVNPTPVPVTGGNHAICNGSSILLGTTPPTSGHSYSWVSSPKGYTNNTSQPYVSPKVTTIYYVTETITATGCSKKDSAIISVITVTAHAGGNHKTCSGSAITIGATAVTGDTYAWTSKPAGFTSTLNNPIVAPKTTTTYYVQETITASGCASTDSAVITVNPAPDAYTGPPVSICTGNSAQIGGVPANGDSYSWKSKPAGFLSTQSNPSVNPTVSTTYYLTESIVTTGCTKTDSVKVTVNPLPDAKWSALDFGKSTILFALDSSLVNAKYHWKFGDGTGSDTANGFHAIHIYPKNKVYSVSLRVTDANGCVKELDSNLLVTISGINSVLSDQLINLVVFPNPFSQSAVIGYDLNKNANIKIVLFDISGKEIGIVANENQQPGKYQFEVNSEKYNLKPGIYIVKVMMDNEYISRHIVKM